jgi:hypothetical protein
MNLLPQWQGSAWPPGGFPFVDPRTGMKFDAMSGNIDHKIGQVQQHRRANPTVYPNGEGTSADFIRQEIVDYMCGRNMSLCMEGTITSMAKPSNPAAIVQTVNCPSCGKIDAVPTFCVTCGGNKVKYWTCSCGTQF